jgi:hypothetical protein
LAAYIESQVLSFDHCPMVARQEIEPVAESDFAVVAKTSLPACQIISKLLFAYLEGPGLLAVAPCRLGRGTADHRAAVITKKVAGEAFYKLNVVKKKEHTVFLKHMLWNGTVGLHSTKGVRPPPGRQQHGLRGRTTTSRPHRSCPQSLPLHKRH